MAVHVQAGRRGVSSESRVAVPGYVRTVRPDFIGFWNGVAYDPPDADGRKREKWAWLPRDRVTWVYAGRQRHQKATAWMPVETARLHGLAYVEPNAARRGAGNGNGLHAEKR